MPTDTECDCDYVSKEWLLSKLRSDERDTILIDCRGSNDYSLSHIRSAVNFSIPSIMLRRLAAGKIDLCSTVQCKELKAKITQCRANGTFVLYGDEGTRDPDSMFTVLHKRLKQDGVQVVIIEDDFDGFHRAYPEWCSEAGGQPVPHLPLMGLRCLRISGSGCDDAISSGSSSECEESGAPAPEFPVEILPNLYLGNSSNSEDCQALARHNIKYVLNVTPDLPNTFETDGGGINYMKIPIADHWSQNLTMHFPQAIRFIEEAVSSGAGVLVHCVAGVSRSVTFTLAYLMQRHRLCLRDAFELVRARKTDISPNFHFMRQLHTFERELGLHEQSASLSKVLESLGVGEVSIAGERRAEGTGEDGGESGGGGGGAGCGCDVTAGGAGVSPDSGIEWDRWSARHTPQ